MDHVLCVQQEYQIALIASKIQQLLLTYHATIVQEPSLQTLMEVPVKPAQLLMEIVLPVPKTTVEIQQQ